MFSESVDRNSVKHRYLVGHEIDGEFDAKEHTGHFDVQGLGDEDELPVIFVEPEGEADCDGIEQTLMIDPGDEVWDVCGVAEAAPGRPACAWPVWLGGAPVYVRVDAGGGRVPEYVVMAAHKLISFKLHRGERHPGAPGGMVWQPDPWAYGGGGER